MVIAVGEGSLDSKENLRAWWCGVEGTELDWWEVLETWCCGGRGRGGSWFDDSGFFGGMVAGDSFSAMSARSPLLSLTGSLFP